MRYASLAFPTLSLLNSSGMKFDVVGRVTVVRKCSETVVDLEMLDRLSTGLRCALSRL